MRTFLAIGTALFLAACASTPLPTPALAEGQILAVGLYRYEDGDRFRWRCTPTTHCDDGLVRDARLQQLIEAGRIGVNRVVLVVRRVDSCGPDGSAVSCVQSGPTALRIARWIEPAA